MHFTETKTFFRITIILNFSSRKIKFLKEIIFRHNDNIGKGPVLFHMPRFLLV